MTATNEPTRESAGPPAHRGWSFRPGDPAGVQRWYDGTQWTDMLTGGTVQGRAEAERIGGPAGTPTATTSRPPSSGYSQSPRTPSQPQRGGRTRFQYSRELDAFCYVFSGVAILIAEIVRSSTAGIAITLIGLGFIAYGAKVWLVRSAYLVGVFTYFIPVVALLWLFSRF